MAYRTKQTHLVDGVEVLPIASPLRWRNLTLDVLALPLVAGMPRHSVEALGAQLPLEYEFRNWYWRSERCVELALAAHAVKGRDPSSLLEIGNVLSMTGVVGHTVVDKYETGPGVRNVDIMDYTPDRHFDLAVSISTLEHVGHDEHPRDPEKAARALQRIDTLADDLLVTIPVGYNRELEGTFIDGPFERVDLLVKTSRFARWEQQPLSQRAHVQYALPYAYGNGLLVGSRGLTAEPPQN